MSILFQVLKPIFKVALENDERMAFKRGHAPKSNQTSKAPPLNHLYCPYRSLRGSFITLLIPESNDAVFVI